MPKLVIFSVLILAYSIGQLVADPVITSDDEFNNQYGSAILDKIIRGKKVKVSLESARKLTFEQDNSGGCSICENSQTTAASTDQVTNATSATTTTPNTIYVDVANGGHGPYGFSTCNILQPQQDIPRLFITASRPNACNYQLVAAHSPPVDVPSYLDYDDVTLPVDNTYIGIDPYTGQVFYKAIRGTYPCGPGGGVLGNPNTLTESLVYTYEAQCTDSRGIISNTIQFNVLFAPCSIPSDPAYTCTSNSA